MKVLIVAGHGAGDPGAVGCGYKEADLTRELAELIRSAAPGLFTVYDVKKDLYKENGKKAFNFAAYDYTLELHFNAGVGDQSGNGKTTGVEVLNHDGTGGFEAYLAKSIADLGFRNRGIKQRSDLRNMNIAAKQGAKYSLLEVCFIDDRDDVEEYQTKKHEIAETIAKCFVSFYKLKGVEIMPLKKEEKKEEKKVEALSYDPTVDELIKAGITDRANMVHWEKCLAGSIPLKPSEVRTLFDRLLAKIK